MRWIQPDGLIYDFMLGKLTIVEIKLKHTDRAWWQIRRLYQPVLEFLLRDGGWKFTALEVCHYCDAHTSFPERVTFVEKPEAVPVEAFGLHLFSGR
jgi:hypothetical protein